MKNNGATIPDLFYGLVGNGIPAGSSDMTTTYLTVTGNTTDNSSVRIYPRIDVKSIPASDTYSGNTITVNGVTFLDRNLGARRAATSQTDPLSFGSLFQQGRPSDGHEIMVISGINYAKGEGFYDPKPELWISTNHGGSTQPDHTNFIISASTSSPYYGDWLQPQDGTLWTYTPATTTKGVNDPCPSGYHVPITSNLTTAIGSSTPTGVYSSLKIPSAGQRGNSNGKYTNTTNVYVWTGTSGASTPALNKARTNAYVNTVQNLNYRGNGMSVRCVKN